MIKKDNDKLSEPINNKILIFKGAGFPGTGTKEIPNCSIVTIIKNNKERLIYLKINSLKLEENVSNELEKFNIAACIDSCFYYDSKWDKRREYSEEFSKKIFNRHFEYNKKNILKFVNTKLDCSFTDIEIINNDLGILTQPLCDCSEEKSVEYKEKEYNISLLQDVAPIQKNFKTNMAEYKLSYSFVQKIPSIKHYIDRITDEKANIDMYIEKELLKKYLYYAIIKWNKLGVIESLEITAAAGDFAYIGMNLDVLDKVIKTLTKSPKTKKVS